MPPKFTYVPFWSRYFFVFFFLSVITIYIYIHVCTLFTATITYTGLFYVRVPQYNNNNNNNAQGQLPPRRDVWKREFARGKHFTSRARIWTLYIGNDDWGTRPPTIKLPVLRCTRAKNATRLPRSWWICSVYIYIYLCIGRVVVTRFTRNLGPVAFNVLAGRSKTGVTP